LSGGQHSPESVQGLADNLSQLTVRELSDLKKQYGISAAGRSKADLVAKVADRLSRGRREAEQQPQEPEPDVYAPESLFSMNQGLVNALASKMGDRHQQDELRQVGRIALWEAAQKWKPDGGTKFSTFAYTGIARAIKNAQRSEGRQKSKAQEFGVDEEGGDQSQQVPGRDAAPDEDMEKQEQLGQLQDAMKQLQSKSPDAAKMVMMKFSGRKLSEIAAEFGVTEQGASQAVSRAVKKLQTMMGADKMQRTGDIVRYMDAWIRERYAAKPIAAGLCVQAADTGRVLMLQRSWDEDDDAAGTWEFRVRPRHTERRSNRRRQSKPPSTQIGQRRIRRDKVPKDSNYSIG
jgi:RNA polymerase sigma factor (sigma-70 family)